MAADIFGMGCEIAAKASPPVSPADSPNFSNMPKAERGCPSCFATGKTIMKTMNIDLASAEISRLLIGMSLDSLRVYSAVLLLGFHRVDTTTALPGEVWISCSGRAALKNSRPDKLEIMEEKIDFFALRAAILGQIYYLIGRPVTGVDIDSAGRLTVSFSDEKITFESDEDNFEEVWAVMSDSPDASHAHRWYIALDDAAQIGGTISNF